MDSGEAGIGCENGAPEILPSIVIWLRAKGDVILNSGAMVVDVVSPNAIGHSNKLAIKSKAMVTFFIKPTTPYFLKCLKSGFMAFFFRLVQIFS
jgi:hypothetical protein